jgi:hypothetical protein
LYVRKENLFLNKRSIIVGLLINYKGIGSGVPFLVYRSSLIIDACRLRTVVL